jgi:hypothetical protein
LNANSILCEVQEKDRDKEPSEGHPEERQAGDQGPVPDMRNKGLQDRRISKEKWLGEEPFPLLII